jgi:hypothetical protein
LPFRTDQRGQDKRRPQPSDRAREGAVQKPGQQIMRHQLDPGEGDFIWHSHSGAITSPQALETISQWL